MVDFGLIVATALEKDAVLKRMKGKGDGSKSSDYTLGTIQGYRVALIQCVRQGSVSSAIAASDLFSQQPPKNLVLLGIAAGIPGAVKKGSIVIADHILGYEYSKVYDDSSEQEPHPYVPPELNRAAPGMKGKKIRVTTKGTSRVCKVEVGPIASGSKLVASKNFRNKLINRLTRRMHALEMEAEGVGAAAHHFSTPFYVIKGISDFADQRTKGRRRSAKKQKEHDRWQSIAAEASAEAFVEFLKSCKRVGSIRPLHARKSVGKLRKLTPIQTTASEPAFLAMTRGKGLQLGNFQLECKLLPPGLWFADTRTHTYKDDPEREGQEVVVSMLPGSGLPEDLLTTLVDEIDKRLADYKAGAISLVPSELGDLKEVGSRLKKQGSNAYPRVVAPPEIVSQGYKVTVGASRYGIALVEERKLNLHTANALRMSHVLNSLAVRVAVVSHTNGVRLVHFHRRTTKGHGTYKGAWDVGAAGYIDPDRHRDPDDPNRISPWQTCVDEIETELNIQGVDLPHRDHYSFFGLASNDWTGQLDLLGLCELSKSPDPNRSLKPRVTEYEDCVLQPDSIVDFVLKRKRWVPTALLTLALVLRFYGSSLSDVERSFSRLEGALQMGP